MLKWSWLVAAAALSCSSAQRNFSNGNGGSSGQPSNGGTSNGGTSNGGTSNGGTSSGDGGAGDGGVAGMADGGEAGMAGESAAGSNGGDPTCAGCVIDSVCVEAKAQNPENPCQSCDVSRSRGSYSPNLGARCGSAATECSAQDTCDERGACQKNDLDSSTLCSTGACEAGVCKAVQNPFDCIVPSPPIAEMTDQVFGFTGTPPIAKGGVVADGRYAPTRIDLYNSSATALDIRTFEFKKGFVQVASRYFTIDTKAAYIPEVQFSGSFTGTANLLTFNLERCDPQYNIDIPNMPYTATANGLVTIVTLGDGATVVTSYARQ
jgi:hypothetical protein